jgi:hypothetical protein
MPLPLAAISLGAGLLGGLFGNKSKDKQAKEQLRAARELEGKRESSFMADEANRGARVQGIGTQLQRLFGGRYALPPELLEQLSQARPFAGGASTIADPTKGSGFGLASGLLGGLSNAAATAALLGGGSLGAQDVAGAGTPGYANPARPTGLPNFGGPRFDLGLAEPEYGPR